MLQFSLYKALSMTTMSVLLVGGGYLGYRYLRSDIAASVYRDRLAALAGDYESLRTQYNEAIRRTAVTELVVKGSRVTVQVRLPDHAGEPGGVPGAGGTVLRSIETPVDADAEVFVDYVLVNGRLLIRRIFDGRTPPDQAFTIDPALASVDWSDPAACHGTAIYRRLTEGRWAISVTGNGALGLEKVAGDEPMPILDAPQIKSFKEEVARTDEQLRDIGWRDVWNRFTGE